MPFITKLGAVAARAYGWLASVAQAVVSSDTYFYLVSMLLPGNGTNGATNNTFLDSSTNNFTITRNGNTTQGTFSPFSQTGWSVYFDGSGDYLAFVTGLPALQLGAGNFTLEGWVYRTVSATQVFFLGQGDLNTAAGSSYIFYLSSSLTSDLYIGANGYPITSPNPSLNTWAHVAWVRNGGTFTSYLNGVQVGTRTDLGSNAVNVGATNYPPYIGILGNGTSPYTGYISNFRLVKGVALYTNSFTPPATPLTAVSGTSLLTCQSNRIVDNSANNLAITRAGDTAVQAFSPFVPNNISPTSYSGWFDGSGDYLTIPDNAAFELGANNFTIEAWVNFASLPSANGYQATIVSKWATSNASYELYLYNNAGAYLLYLTYSTNGSAATNLGVSWTPSVNTWYHIACVRNSTNLIFYVNGIQQGATQSISGTLFNGTAVLEIGGYLNGSANSVLAGALSNLRIVNGTAVYTSNFTPPTTPLTAIANTSLLTLQNATFIDNSTNAFTITANGNAQPITTNPFQTPSPNPISYSGYFDGSGDYLTVPANAAFNFGTGDFTIEAWIYTPTTQTQYAAIACNYNNPDGWFLSFSTSNVVTFSNYNVVGVTSSSSVPTNAWTHIAVARSGTSLKMFFNGIQVASATNSTTYGATAATSYIGFNNQTHYFSGLISNLRVVKGTALYTANFIPSNTPLTAVSGTSLLTCQDNRFVDNSTNAFAITVNGNTTPVMTNPYGYATPISSTAYGGAFDGATATRLTFPSNTAFAFGTGAYTMEAWVYLTSYATTFSTAIFDCGSTTNSAGMFVTTSGALFLNLYGVGPVIQTSTTVPLNTWTHIAISRQSTAASSTRLFINGVLGATGTDSNNWTVTTTPGVGGIGLAGYTVSGFVSNVRVVKGTAVYTAAFTPSTTPLTAISGTSLLTCQNIVFADNSSNAFTVTVNGNTAPTPVNPFGYSAPTAPTSVSYSALTNGGSGYFDGSGDYLAPPNSTDWVLPGSFTIEFWMYPTSTPAIGGIFSTRNSVSATYGISAALVASDNKIWVEISNSGTNNITLKSSGVIALNTWQHLAIVGTNGTSLAFYLNGVLQASGTITQTPAYNSCAIGRYYTDVNNYYFPGYISSLRVIKGTALYTAAFTPPVLPLTAIANTSLLLNYTNAGIYDAASKNDLETSGGMQITTAQAKWGGTSMLFPSTAGSYLVTNSTPNLALGSGDFTVEFWVYFATSAASKILVDWRPSGTDGVYPTLYTGASSLLAFYTSSADRIVSGSAMSVNTWLHIALVRSSGTTKLYVNGTQVGSNYTDSNNYLGSAGRPYIGGSSRTINDGLLNGYINDFRITRYARYTANFTPPTAAFPTR